MAIEGAELFVAPGNGSREGARRTLVLRVRPETFTCPDRLRALLRHELLHIADMLDPAFGYEPRWAEPARAPLDHLFRERYRILWDAFIDGRLVRLGRAPGAVRGERLGEFARAFGMLGERTEEAFGRFFGATRLTHAELGAFAADPEGALGRRKNRRHPGEGCPLCGFPSHAFEPEPDRLPAAVRRRIRESFPSWKPADGICRLCADLYRSRAGLAEEGAGDATGSRRRA
jgi:hypothetical protein